MDDGVYAGKYFYPSNFFIIYLMLSPMSTFATRDFVAKVDVGPRVGGPACPQHCIFLIHSRYLIYRLDIISIYVLKGLQECMWA